MAAKEIPSTAKYSQFIGIVSDIGFFGLIVFMIPALVLPISFNGAVIIFAISIVTIVLTKFVLVNF
jgi:hypothetical protein